MSVASMSMFNLFVPTTDNSGEAIDPEVVQEVRAAIRQFTGHGCTSFPEGVGEWPSPWGELFQDSVLMLSSTVPTCPDTERFFRQLAHELAVQLEQHTIFLYRVTVEIDAPEYVD